jgi:hypothetical protein
MVTKVERKGRPISVRLPEADIAIIDRAAGLRGLRRCADPAPLDRGFAGWG